VSKKPFNSLSEFYGERSNPEGYNQYTGPGGSSTPKEKEKSFGPSQNKIDKESAKLHSLEIKKIEAEAKGGKALEKATAAFKAQQSAVFALKGAKHKAYPGFKP